MSSHLTKYVAKYTISCNFISIDKNLRYSIICILYFSHNCVFAIHFTMLILLSTHHRKAPKKFIPYQYNKNKNILSNCLQQGDILLKSFGLGKTSSSRYKSKESQQQTLRFHTFLEQNSYPCALFSDQNSYTATISKHSPTSHEQHIDRCIHIVILYFTKYTHHHQSHRS